MRIFINLLVGIALTFILMVTPAMAVSDPANGDFEGGFAGCGNNDQCPNGWILHETSPGENSVATSIADNGPSQPGSNAVSISRSGGGSSGDWTTVYQNLGGIVVIGASDATLSLDVKVLSHNLEAGGWVTPAFEWPAMVEIRYTKIGGGTEIWRHGWYLDPPEGDGEGSRVIDPGSGLILEYGDTLVSPDTWVTASFDLLAELPQAQSIDRIEVGGSGWDFVSRIDNVSVEVEVPIPTLSEWGMIVLAALLVVGLILSIRKLAQRRILQH